MGTVAIDGDAENSSAGSIPVGEQRFSVSEAFAREFNAAVDPVVLAERVWLARRQGQLLLHMGPRTVMDRSQHAEPSSAAGSFG
jgi:hypothetical protein